MAKGLLRTNVLPTSYDWGLSRPDIFFEATCTKLLLSIQISFAPYLGSMMERHAIDRQTDTVM